jgi:hypothetical protein
MKAKTIPKIPVGVQLSLPSIPPNALNTMKSRREIHHQIIIPIIIFPKNPPNVTSFGALSRSFISGFFTIGSVFVGGTPQSGVMSVGSKVCSVIGTK